jgi:hypothetical protein
MVWLFDGAILKSTIVPAPGTADATAAQLVPWFVDLKRFVRPQ